MAPADPALMQQAVAASPRYANYAEPVDRESARERLAAKLEEGARKAAEDAAYAERQRRAKLDRAEQPRQEQRQEDGTDDGSLVGEVVRSPAFKEFMRTAAREIARGMFGSGRR
jgi:hypothetical protein